MRTALFRVTAPVVAALLAAPAASAQVRPPTETPSESPRPVRDLDVNSVLDLMIDIAQILIAFVAVIAVIMVVWGGAVYATSRGEEGKVEGARKTITYGIIGLVVALLAFAVISFANSIVSQVN